MGYLQSITRFSQADNLAGLVQLQLIRKADVLAIPTPVNGIIHGDLTLAAGAAFVTWQCKLETPRITTEEQGSREGSSKKNILALTIPKDRSDLRYMFSKMAEDEFIVTFLENGKRKMFGQLHAPVRFIWNHDSGASFDNLNAYSAQFFYTGPDNIYFYEGDIDTAPSGAAPSVVSFNGVPIASLTAGQNLNIVSEYSFTEYFVTE